MGRVQPTHSTCSARRYHNTRLAMSLVGYRDRRSRLQAASINRSLPSHSDLESGLESGPYHSDKGLFFLLKAGEIHLRVQIIMIIKSRSIIPRTAMKHTRQYVGFPGSAVFQDNLKSTGSKILSEFESSIR